MIPHTGEAQLRPAHPQPQEMDHGLLFCLHHITASFPHFTYLPDSVCLRSLFCVKTPRNSIHSEQHNSKPTGLLDQHPFLSALLSSINVSRSTLLDGSLQRALRFFEHLLCARSYWLWPRPLSFHFKLTLSNWHLNYCCLPLFTRLSSR